MAHSPGLGSAASSEGVTGEKLDQDECIAGVLAIFNDIDSEYVENLSKTHGYISGAVIAAILDDQEKGIGYPRQVVAKKRMTGSTQDEIDAILVSREHTRHWQTPVYKNMAKTLLGQDFPTALAADIQSMLVRNRGSLCRTYQFMDDALRNNKVTWKPRQRPRTAHYEARWLVDTLETSGSQGLSEAEIAAFREFRLARAERDRLNALEAENLQSAMRDNADRVAGSILECGCCFDDFPQNRLIGCDGDTTHLFCRGCLGRYIDDLIGKGRFSPECLSNDSCQAGFSWRARQLFIDEKQQIALDRLEIAASLRTAAFEDLETCPFCPYAMEYPPVEVNKEFRCQNPNCEIISCRKCRKKTHIPKSCEEVALEETGHSARHTIEEAMSDAVIRKCNKCDYPFIKAEGCNKIVCTRCHTLQCYVCRETVKDYTHFNDAGRGGRTGQCPLFDSSDLRHQNEAEVAEQAMRKKVMQDNPEVHEDVFKFRMSEKVKEDGKRLERHGQRVADLYGDAAAAPFPVRLGPPIAAPGLGIPALQRPPRHAHQDIDVGLPMLPGGAQGAPAPEANQRGRGRPEQGPDLMMGAFPRIGGHGVFGGGIARNNDEQPDRPPGEGILQDGQAWGLQGMAGAFFDAAAHFGPNAAHQAPVFNHVFWPAAVRLFGGEQPAEDPPGANPFQQLANGDINVNQAAQPPVPHQNGARAGRLGPRNP